jgi:hypothetical protein
MTQVRLRYLGYAVTAHRAQGVTTDTAHVLVTPATTRENLYVAMTRGRHHNHAYVAIDRPDQTHRLPHPGDPDNPTAISVLTTVLRNGGQEPSAHQAAVIEHEQWNNIAQLAAEYETLAAAATRDRWTNLIRSTLPEHQTEAVLASEAFGPLTAALRQAEARGWNPETELPRLTTARPLDYTTDPAAALNSRVNRVLDHLTARPPRRRQQLIAGLIPKATGPISPPFQQALNERETAIEARADQLLRQAITNNEPWLAELGPRPANPHTAKQWLQAARTAAAYRERHQVTEKALFGANQEAAQLRDSDRLRALIAQATDHRDSAASPHQPIIPRISPEL